MNAIHPFRLMFLSTINFILATGLAMLLYPGGKYHDHHSLGYSFIENFFSDLGRWRTFTGETKQASLFLFVYAMCTLALSTLLFVRGFLKDHADRQRYPVSYYTAIVSALIFSVCIFGVVLTPYDLLLDEHILVTRLAFIAMVPLSWSVSFLIYRHDEVPNRFMLLLFSVSFVLIVYVYILFFGPKVSENRYFQPIAQKAIVYLLSVSLMYLSYGCRKYLLVRA